MQVEEFAVPKRQAQTEPDALKQAVKQNAQLQKEQLHKDLQKVCPLARGLPDSESILCIGEKCACHIQTVKPAFITERIIDPEDFYSYDGCGLVTNIPWKLEKRQKKGAAQ